MSPVEYVAGFDEALEMVLRRGASVEKTSVERLALLECLGRVLAKDVAADRDQPPFARSARDGFAVRAAEVSAGTELRVSGLVRAGEQWGGPALARGEAIEIMTGAPVPDGADAVVMVEHVKHVAGSVRLMDGRSVQSGENVVPRGCEARAGDVVLRAGSEIR